MLFWMGTACAEEKIDKAQEDQMCSADKGRAPGTLALHVNNLGEERRTADTVKLCSPSVILH